jgi:hypothetical protein
MIISISISIKYYVLKQSASMEAQFPGKQTVSNIENENCLKNKK